MVIGFVEIEACKLGKKLVLSFSVSHPHVGNRVEKGSLDSCLTIEHDVYLIGPLRRRGPGTPQARQPAAASELINKHYNITNAKRTL